MQVEERESAAMFALGPGARMPIRTTIVTNSASELAPIFSMTRPRRTLIFFSTVPRSGVIWPAMRRHSTSCCSSERLLQFETVEFGRSHIQEIQEKCSQERRSGSVQGSLLPRRRSRFGSRRSAVNGQQPAVRLSHHPLRTQSRKVAPTGSSASKCSFFSRNEDGKAMFESIRQTSGR